jgi:hypothetical protein
MADIRKHHQRADSKQKSDSQTASKRDRETARPPDRHTHLDRLVDRRTVFIPSPLTWTPLSSLQTHRHTAASTQQTADSRQQTADSRQPTADSRQSLTKPSDLDASFVATARRQADIKTCRHADRQTGKYMKIDRRADRYNVQVALPSPLTWTPLSSPHTLTHNNSTQQTADSIQQTAYSTQQTADSKHQTADSRQTANSRRQTLTSPSDLDASFVATARSAAPTHVNKSKPRQPMGPISECP